MPRGDGTGPGGMGPMTGRAAGYCAGYEVPGYMNPIPGRGFGRGFGRGWGRGFGRGWGRGYGPAAFGGYAPAPGAASGGYAPVPGYAPYGAYPGAVAPQVTREQEVEMLKAQAENARGALEDIQKRIEELEAAKE